MSQMLSYPWLPVVVAMCVLALVVFKRGRKPPVVMVVTQNHGFEIKPSARHGLGVFAVRSYELGDLVGVYRGRVSMDSEDPYFLYVDETEQGDQWGIMGDGPLRYMNHSDDPTTVVDGALVYAAKPIEPGDEITFHYGDEWEEDGE